MKIKNTINSLFVACAVAGLTMFSLTSCDRDSPAENAGEDIKNAAEDVGDGVGEAVEDAGDALEDAAN